MTHDQDLAAGSARPCTGAPTRSTTPRSTCSTSVAAPPRSADAARRGRGRRPPRSRSPPWSSRCPCCPPAATTGGWTSSRRTRSPRSPSRCGSTRRQPPRARTPRVPYVVVDTRQLVTPAATYDLPEAYLQVVPDGDGGWVALSQGTPRTGITVQMLDSDFGVTDGGGGPTSGLAVREDGGHVAFTQYDGVGRWTLLTTALPRVADYTYTEVATRSSQEAVHRPLGYVSDDSVVVEASDPDTGQYSLSGGRRRRHHDRLRRLQPRREHLVGDRTGGRADGVHRRRLLLGVLDPLSAEPGPRVGDLQPPARGLQPGRPLHRRAGRRTGTGSGRPPSASWTRRRASRWSTSSSGNDPGPRPPSATSSGRTRRRCSRPSRRAARSTSSARPSTGVSSGSSVRPPRR